MLFIEIDKKYPDLRLLEQKISLNIWNFKLKISRTHNPARTQLFQKYL